MSKKKDVVKAPRCVIRENSRLMRAHESMVDYISGRSSASLMDVLAPALLGLGGFLRPLEDDIIFSDEDDDDDEYEDDDDDDDSNDPYYRPRRAVQGALEPHPQIKQLTDEEADKIAKELIDEEERRKEKTRKNKRKKMRKKEKKRLEKENAKKENLHEEEQAKSDSSENQEDTAIIESSAEAMESSQNATEAGGHEKSDNTEEINVVEVNKKEDKEQKNEDLHNSCAASAKSVPEETSNQSPAKEKTKRDTNKLPEVRQPEEKKPEVAEKQPEVRKKKEEKPEARGEKTVEPVLDEFAKRSIELANMGNRSAASGQFEMAVRYFTDAIKHNPKEFKLFGNRSLCFERLQQYENALRDADVALSMEPNWIKGLFRKGKALCGLKRYYEASLIYKEVLKLEKTSVEAAQELKRAQTLHLMEMGFSWSQSSEALKSHATLEEAVEALFAGDGNQNPEGAGARRDRAAPSAGQEHPDDGEWTVQQTSRPRTQHGREFEALDQNRAKSHSPTPPSRNPGKPDLFSVWVGFLPPAMTYVKLHELFSRAGTVYSIKMLLEHQCAFVNYTRKEECDRAIQCINGMVVEGAPLTVRYPYKTHNGLGMSTDAGMRPGMFKKTECFFWRTTGCTRQDCIYKHIPEHKNIDKGKFTNRLGFPPHAGNQK
ncbi:uncharacterized protein si:dkey-33c12.4 [Acanthochromis polyacanthus]|uniref:uncharacterized protein si:dkey-33c12.4 n=1 Tax=Acanthochromis polyacanthus TaxID=80966 RepID=UPI0022342694|nr:uncharacterized protein si:dkey-33c12.4 [Acanthochromis polyacanthus]